MQIFYEISQDCSSVREEGEETANRS